MKAIRAPDSKVIGNRREVVAAVAESFRTRHNTAQEGPSETAGKIVRPQVFTKG